MLLRLILASKLSELVQFENWAENYQKARKGMKIRPKANWCHCQALEIMFLGWGMFVS